MTGLPREGRRKRVYDWTRTPIRRSRPLRRRTPIKRVIKIRPVSDRGGVLGQLDDLLRQAILLRDDFQCRRCRKRPQVRDHIGQPGIRLSAAHIYGKGAHPGMRYVLLNVLCLCDGPGSCHAWWHQHGFGQEGIVREWIVGEIGSSAMARLDEMAASDGLGSLDLERARYSLEQAIRRFTTIPSYSDYDRTRRPDLGNPWDQ